MSRQTPDEKGQAQALLPHDVAMELAQGEAALMLLECLMLVLVEKKQLDKEQVVDAIETVLATKMQMVTEGEQPQLSLFASGLLRRIANSVAAAHTEAESPRAS